MVKLNETTRLNTGSGSPFHLLKPSGHVSAPDHAMPHLSCISPQSVCVFPYSLSLSGAEAA